MSEGYFEDGMNLKTDVELLKKDLHSLYKVVDKLDVTIDKLSEVTVYKRRHKHNKNGPYLI